MKIILSILALAIALPLRASVYEYVQINFTNSTGTTNGQSFTLNGDKRTFTNSVIIDASQIFTNSTLTGAAALALSQVARHPFTGLTIVTNTSTYFTLRSADGAHIVGSYSGNWGNLGFATNTFGGQISLALPVSLYPLPQQTNLDSLLVLALMSSADTNYNQLQFPLNQITNAGTAGYSNATDFVIAPTNTPSEGQFISRTGNKNKWSDPSAVTSVDASNVVSGGVLGSNTLSATAGLDGWLLGQSNSLPVWTQDGGGLSNITASSATTATTSTFTTGNSAALTNGVYETNAIFPYSIFASASNQITLNNTYWLLSVSTGFSITNAIGQSAGNATWATLLASNSSASSVTGYVTVPAIRAIGSATTNALIVPAGKIGVFSLLSMGSLLTNYWDAVQQ